MKRKVKKIFAVVSVLVCLISVNLSLFTVGASANVVPAGNYSHRTIGAPVSLSFYTFKDGEPYFGLINRPNVYYYKDGSYLPWYEGPHYDNYLFNFDYQAINTGSADVFIYWHDISNVSTLTLDNPILFTNFSDLDNNYNFNFGVYNPQDALGYRFDSFVVDYEYIFVNAIVDSTTGDTVFNDVVVRSSVQFTTSFTGSDYLAVVPFFNDTILTDNLIADNKNFVGQMFGESYCYLKSATVNFIGVFSNYYYFNPVFNGANKTLADYNRTQFQRSESIYVAESYEEHIVFEDLSWTDWLVNSVSGFLDFQIVPGLSFAGMLGLLVGMSLFIVFLKVFAGG